MNINGDLFINNTSTSLNDLANLREKVLWTNSNPSADFSSQKINLSSTDYDYYMVIFTTSTSLAVWCNTGLIPKGKRCELSTCYSENNQFWIRYRGTSAVADGSITFNNAVTMESKGNTSSNSNYYCIPVYIIGYKK